ncbi:hypothetical protein ACPW96_21740 [Micromonospora sp. DT81.3]|uniref:hypothetical protein n=1 Tax=Micromonospora sp. DT81.3 TaxID=3416523 RepID=UPI003CF5626F
MAEDESLSTAEIVAAAQWALRGIVIVSVALGALFWGVLGDERAPLIAAWFILAAAIGLLSLEVAKSRKAKRRLEAKTRMALDAVRDSQLDSPAPHSRRRPAD